MPSSQPDPVDNRTPLMLAAAADDLCELFDLLLAGAALEQQDSRQWTALTHACWYGNYEIAQQLLDSGADPNVHESYSMAETPLSIAARRGHFDIVRLLIAHDADPTCYAGIEAVTAEAYARYNGHLDICQFLRGHEDRCHRLKSQNARKSPPA